MVSKLLQAKQQRPDRGRTHHAVREADVPLRPRREQLEVRRVGEAAAETVVEGRIEPSRDRGPTGSGVTIFSFGGVGAAGRRPPVAPARVRGDQPAGALPRGVLAVAVAGVLIDEIDGGEREGPVVRVAEEPERLAERVQPYEGQRHVGAGAAAHDEGVVLRHLAPPAASATSTTADSTSTVPSPRVVGHPAIPPPRRLSSSHAIPRGGSGSTWIYAVRLVLRAPAGRGRPGMGPCEPFQSQGQRSTRPCQLRQDPTPVSVVPACGRWQGDSRHRPSASCTTSSQRSIRLRTGPRRRGDPAT